MKSMRGSWIIFIAISAIMDHALGLSAVAPRDVVWPLHGWVSDTAGYLHPDAVTEINAIIARLDSEKDCQIGLVIIPAMEPGYGDIQHFTHQVFSLWRIANQAKLNALMLLSIDDRQMRIHTNPRMRNVLTDHHCEQIIAEMKPKLKAGDYTAACKLGIQMIERALWVKPEQKYEVPTAQYLFDSKKEPEVSTAELLRDCFGIAYWGFFIGYPIFLILSGIIGYFFPCCACCVPEMPEPKQKPLDARLRQLQSEEFLQKLRSGTHICAICLEELALDAAVRKKDDNAVSDWVVLPCGHPFHKTCIKDWLARKDVCPLCRKPNPMMMDSDTKNKEDMSFASHEGHLSNTTTSLTECDIPLLHALQVDLFPDSHVVIVPPLDGPDCNCDCPGFGGASGAW